MSRRYVTSAKTRAAIAARMILAAKREQFHCWPRAFDNCFEEGDGDLVVKLLCRRASQDDALRSAMQFHGFGVWLERNPQKSQTDPQTMLFTADS